MFYFQLKLKTLNCLKWKKKPFLLFSPEIFQILIPLTAEQFEILRQ